MRTESIAKWPWMVGVLVLGLSACAVTPRADAPPVCISESTNCVRDIEHPQAIIPPDTEHPQRLPRDSKQTRERSVAAHDHITRR